MAVSTPEDDSREHTEAPVASAEQSERVQAAMYCVCREVMNALPQLTEIVKRLGDAMAEGFEQLAAADERFREVLRKARNEANPNAKPAP